MQQDPLWLKGDLVDHAWLRGFDMWTDADWGGCLITREKTSGFGSGRLPGNCPKQHFLRPPEPHRTAICFFFLYGGFLTAFFRTSGWPKCFSSHPAHALKVPKSCVLKLPVALPKSAVTWPKRSGHRTKNYWSHVQNYWSHFPNKRAPFSHNYRTPPGGAGRLSPTQTSKRNLSALGL